MPDLVRLEDWAAWLEEEAEAAEEADSVAALHRRLVRDPRFNPPPPAAWKRAALVLLVIFLFFLTFWLRGPKPKHVAKPDIEYEELCVVLVRIVDVAANSTAQIR